MEQIKVPKGTKDIFPPEVERWQYVEKSIRAYFSRFLYREIRTPMFEHSELFTRGIGSETEVVRKEMYTFQDKGGRSLTLRPENTASVVRAAIENKLFDQFYPLKFFYIGPMFRYDRPQKGRYRQFHQFGIEVFGADSPQVDAEVIYAAVDFLRQLPIQDVQLHLNSVGCRSCRPGYLRQLQDAARLNLASLCEDCRWRAEANPLRIFDCKHGACVAITQSFPKITDFLCPECQDHFRRVQESLAHFDVSYDINSRLVRGLDYYTKTAFEITSGQLGAQNALLGGGRYNDLAAELGGPDVPGIGFAAGMERIILHLQDIPAERAAVLFLAFQNEALLAPAIAIARRLWQEGYAVLLDYQAGNFKKQLKRADRAQAQYTLILGEEEITNKTIALKNMKTQEQILIQQTELIPWLKKNL